MNAGIPGTSSAASAGVRAAVARDQRVELASVARPSRAAGMVLVRPTHALVTPFEREVVRGLGRARDGARTLGYAFCGVVEEADPAAPALARGARVVVHPVFSCGRCDRCAGGLSIHCATREIAGFDAAAGGLCELVAVPASACVAIPKSLDESRAVFAAPLARAIEAVKRGGVARRTYASVLGDDLFAILATLVAVEENPLARLVATSEATLRAAEQFGIRHRALAETGRRGDQELVIDVTGSAESIATAAAMVRPRGHVVVGGISARASVAVDLSHLALNEVEVHGSGFGPLAGALDRLAGGAILPDPLVSRRIGLADAAKALALLGESGVFSVLVQVTR
jgi:threonine dehydrogenase-like Zn-dependent dehydrogenase